MYSRNTDIESLLNQLIETKLLKKLNPDYEEILDSLWLGVQMGEIQVIDEPIIPSNPKIDSSPYIFTFFIFLLIKNSLSQLALRWLTPRKRTKPSPVADITPQTPPPAPESGIKQPQGLSFQVPAAPAIQNPLSLSRALRPLRRKVPSSTKTMLDEEKTAERMAERDIWVPVTQPQPERWLTLELVIEDTRSSFIWRELIKNWQKVLEIEGAFQTIRTWQLSSPDTQRLKLRRYRRNGKPSQREYSHRELLHSNQRGLVLLVSDCVSPLWETGLIHDWLKKWSDKQPSAIIQLLPERLWKNTQLGRGTKYNVISQRQGVPNLKLILKNHPQWLPINWQKSLLIPIVTIQTPILKQWSGVVAGQSQAQITAILFDLKFIQEKAKAQRNASPVNLAKSSETPEEIIQKAESIVRRYFNNASEPAIELATLMASLPVNMSVVDLLRKSYQGEIGIEPVHVAEFYMGGLLTPISETEDGYHREYNFLPSVRRVLNKSIGSQRSIRVLDKISAYIAQDIDRPIRNFTALLRFLKESTLEEREKVLPFAQVGLEVLKNFGGDYKAYAEKIAPQIIPDSELSPISSINNPTEERYLKQRHLLWQQGKTKIYSFCTDESWKLSFDALVIPSGYKVKLTGSFARAFRNFLGLENSKLLVDLVEQNLSGNFQERIYPESPLIIFLPAEIKSKFSQINSSKLNQFLIFATVESESRELNSVNAFKATEKVIFEIANREISHLVIPLLGTGNNGLPVDEVANEMLLAISQSLNNLSDNKIQEITFVDKQESTIETINEIAKSIFVEPSYTQLRNLLAHGNWHEADKETERLIRVATKNELNLTESRLTTENKKQLENIMSAIFSNAEDWQRFIRVAFDRNLVSRLNLYAPPREIAISLIVLCERLGYLDKLISALLNYQLENQQLQIFLQRLSPKISFESLGTIACQDWNTIDKLWNQYSNGRFGIGVQLNIWKNGDDNSATYHKYFAEKVGWGRLENNYMQWRELDSLDFSLSAPVGHLPRAWYKNCEGTLKDLFSFLTQRFDDCGIETSIKLSRPDLELTHKLIEENKERLKDLIVEQFINADYELQLSKHPENYDIENIEEVIVAEKEKIEPSIIDHIIENFEENTLILSLEIEIKFSIAIRYRDWEAYIPQVHESEPPYYEHIFSDQLVQGKAEVEFSITEDFSKSELESIELDIDEPIEVNDNNIKIPDDKGRYRAKQVFIVSENRNYSIFTSVENIITDSSWLELTTEKSNADYIVKINEQEEYLICDSTETPYTNLGSPLLIHGSDTPKKLVKRLIHLAQYHSTLELENAESELSNAIEYELLDSNKNHFSDPSNVTLQQGDRVYVRVKNISNQPLNIALLSFESTWAISLISIGNVSGKFSLPTSQELQPNQEIETRFRFIELNKVEKEGKETLKLFVTREKVKFEDLKLPSLDSDSDVNYDFQQRIEIKRQIINNLVESSKDDWFTKSINITVIKARTREKIELLHTLKGHEDVILRIAWSPDGQFLATPSVDKTIKIWDALNARLIHTLEGHSYGVNHVAWSPNGKNLASSSCDNTIRIWNSETGQCHHVLGKYNEASDKDIGTVAWSPDGRTLASGSKDSTIKLWDTNNWQLLAILEGHTNDVTRIAWSPDGQILASCSADSTIGLWDTQTRELRQVLKRSGKSRSRRIICVAWSPDQTLLASSSYREIEIWNFDRQAKMVLKKRLENLGSVKSFRSDITCISFSQDGRLLATKGMNSTIRLFSCETWREVEKFAEPSSNYWGSVIKECIK